MRITYVIGIALLVPWESSFSQEASRASATQVVAFAVSRSSSALLHTLNARPSKRVVVQQKITVLRTSVLRDKDVRDRASLSHVDLRAFETLFVPMAIKEEPVIVTVTD